MGNVRHVCIDHVTSAMGKLMLKTHRKTVLFIFLYIILVQPILVEPSIYEFSQHSYKHDKQRDVYTYRGACDCKSNFTATDSFQSTCSFQFRDGIRTATPTARKYITNYTQITCSDEFPKF